MKVLICSYQNLLDGKTDYMVKKISEMLPNASIEIAPYHNSQTLINALENIDGLLTYFIPIGEDVLSKVPHLKHISIASTGYSNIDLEAAKRYGIKVSCVKEYCTDEVADHTLALMLTLSRNIIAYDASVKNQKEWDYESTGKIRRLNMHTLAIYGLGRIGQAVAKRAKSFGMTVIAYDPYISTEVASALGVTLVDHAYIQKHATIISNHMNANADNTNFFNKSYFDKLENNIIFINVSRGQSVDESALLEAVKCGKIVSTGLDVLKSESPDLKTHPLIGVPNILVTPHAAFYSEEAIHDCDHISTMNLIHALKGEDDKVFAYLNA